MGYSAQEERDLNQKLHKWQRKQLRAVQKGKNIDKAYEQMSELDRRVWEIIANAETHKDVNWIVWNMAENIIDRYCKIAG